MRTETICTFGSIPSKLYPSPYTLNKGLHVAAAQLRPVKMEGSGLVLLLWVGSGAAAGRPTSVLLRLVSDIETCKIKPLQ